MFEPATNPAWSGYCADPAVFFHGGFYYVYGTHFPGEGAVNAIDELEFVVLRSPDLKSWDHLGGALRPVAGVPRFDYWAPEVAFAQGRFWMYYSCVQPWRDGPQHRLRLAVADRPEGPFSDVGKLLVPEEGFTIDASPFHDPASGRWYLYFARDTLSGRPGTGTAVAELADDMAGLSSRPLDLVLPSADWQISSRQRTVYGIKFDAWHTVEGPHVVYRDGRYYCFYSGGNFTDDSYGLAYAVADHPLGPWCDAGTTGPVVFRGTSTTRGPGHNTVALAPDGETHVCVYHAWDADYRRRQLCLDPIAWTPDGPRVQPTHA